MYDVDQLRRNVQVMDLLTRSFDAHSRGDIPACNRFADEALDCDPMVFSALQGGMIIGEVPNPERDWAGWREYVDSARDKLAQAETGGS